MNYDAAAMTACTLAPAAVNIIHEFGAAYVTFAWQGRSIFSRSFGSVKQAMAAIDDMADDLCVEVLHLDIIGIR